MPRIFWVRCPKCQGEFCCHYTDFRNSGQKLLCPFCQERFSVDESPEIRE
ncbi:MAG: hypothetical protein Q7O66_22375 [Dehalococcoidia bacterium]|nr:hypothetical protein [Dehalococcoidia bacterium]